MSIQFINKSREDQLATLTMGFALSSVLFLGYHDYSIISVYAFMAGVWSGILTLLFTGIGKVWFYFKDRERNQEIAKYGYAWDHVMFANTKSKVLSYTRLILSSLFIVIIIGAGLEPFYTFWFDKWVIFGVLLVLLIFIAILLYFELKDNKFNKKLDVVRILNILDKVNVPLNEYRNLARENRWGELYKKLRNDRERFDYELISNTRKLVNKIKNDRSTFQNKKGTFHNFLNKDKSWFLAQSGLIDPNLKNYRQEAWELIEQFYDNNKIPGIKGLDILLEKMNKLEQILEDLF